MEPGAGDLFKDGDGGGVDLNLSQQELDELRREHDLSGDATEEEILQAVREAEEEFDEQSAMQLIQAGKRGRSVSGPEDLEVTDGNANEIEVQIPTGRFWEDGEPKKVDVTLSIPDNALDIASQYEAYQHRRKARLRLYEHFVKEPKWLIDPERHGIFPDEIHPSDEEWETELDPEERERRERKMSALTSTLTERLDLKIKLAAGLDGDFFSDRLKQMPSSALTQLSNLSSRSRGFGDAPRQRSDDGPSGTEQKPSSMGEPESPLTGSDEQPTQPTQSPREQGQTKQTNPDRR